MSEYSDSEKRPSSKRLLIAVAMVIALTFVIYTTTDYFQQSYRFIDENLFGEKQSKQQVTFYQWSDENGKMVISRNKPSKIDNFITFQASNDLMQNENTVDQSLIDKSSRYQADILSQSDKKNVSGNAKSNTNSKQEPSSSVYPFNAISKTKRCVNLSTQMSVARNKKKDISALKERYEKEC